MRFAAFALALLAASSAQAETHLVKMLNGNALGGMVYEPEFLTVAPGDRVKFLATQRGHNAASIAGFLPEGAQSFLRRINGEIEIALDHEGFYGIKCSPHYDMGMVMLIRVGAAPLDSVSPRGASGARRQDPDRGRDLAERLGCALEETPLGLQIRTDAARETTIPGA